MMEENLHIKFEPNRTMRVETLSDTYQSEVVSLSIFV